MHPKHDQLMGRMAQCEQATLQVLTQEVIKTSETEGEDLSLDAVRPSNAFTASAPRYNAKAKTHEQLEATQKGPLDVTPWLSWFLGCLLCAVQGADALLVGVLDGFESKLTNAKWAALGKLLCGYRTARHQRPAGARSTAQAGRRGRSTGYALCIK